MEQETKTRYLGYCPICERDIKLADNKLVHHGYQRPGHGSIVGDCFAVFGEPYELTDEVCKDWREGQVQHKVALENHLGKLQSNEVTHMAESHQNRRTGEWIVEEYIAGVTAPHYFFNHLDRLIQHTKYEIRGCESEIKRMDLKIQNWTLKPVRTIEEAVEQERQKKADRQAEQDAARQARADKAAALKTKNEARETEREALVVRYRGIFTQLATKEVTRDVRLEAINHWKKMCSARGKRAYLYFYDKALACDDALIKLQLAEVRTVGDSSYTEYAHKTGFVR